SRGDESLSEETREVLKDFTSIAEVDPSETGGQGRDEQEKDYMQVVEYVRMAVITVFMQTSKPTVEAGQSDSDGFIH
ncbi:MAG: UPF0149 family protein, partial [Pseudohongiellaceae bacterium]